MESNGITFSNWNKWNWIKLFFTKKCNKMLRNWGNRNGIRVVRLPFPPTILSDIFEDEKFTSHAASADSPSASDVSHIMWQHTATSRIASQQKITRGPVDLIFSFLKFEIVQHSFVFHQVPPVGPVLYLFVFESCSRVGSSNKVNSSPTGGTWG